MYSGLCDFATSLFSHAGRNLVAGVDGQVESEVHRVKPKYNMT